MTLTWTESAADQKHGPVVLRQINVSSDKAINEIVEALRIRFSISVINATMIMLLKHDYRTKNLHALYCNGDAGEINLALKDQRIYKAI